MVLCNYTCIIIDIKRLGSLLIIQPKLTIKLQVFLPIKRKLTNLKFKLQMENQTARKIDKKMIPLELDEESRG